MVWCGVLGGGGEVGCMATVEYTVFFLFSFLFSVVCWNYGEGR